MFWTFWPQPSYTALPVPSQNIHLRTVPVPGWGTVRPMEVMCSAPRADGIHFLGLE